MRSVVERLETEQASDRERLKQVAAREEALQGLMRGLPGMVYRCRVDAAWTMEFVGDGALSLTGHTALELNAAVNRVSYRGLIHPEDLGLALKAIRVAVAEEQPYAISYRLCTAAGEERWVLDQGAAEPAQAGEPRMRAGFVLDITDRKRVEASLREGEEKLRSIYTAMSEGVCVLALVTDDAGEVMDYRVADINPAFERLTGLSAPYTLGRLGTEVFHSRRPPHLDKLCQVARSGRPATFESDDFVSGRTFRLACFALGPHKAAMVLSDMTDRRRAEQALRSSEGRFREFFSQMTTGAVIYDGGEWGSSFTIKDINAAGERVDKVRREDVVGRNVLDVFPGVVESGLLEMLKKVWLSGRSEHMDMAHYKDERISGWRENHVYKLPSGEIVSLFQDVSERRLMENKIVAKQKMEAIGILAGGVANDFSNILTLMGGQTAAILDAVSPESKAYANAQRLLEAEHYASRLVKRLLSVARAGDVQGTVSVGPVAVADAVQGTVELLAGTCAEKGIACRVKNPEAMPYVMADDTQLRDAIMNLLLNAIRATPAGGVVQVDVSERDVKTPNHRLNPNAKPGRYVILRVRDTGQGIDPKVIDRIFEPFFTTDETGASMGLGLCIVQSSVFAWGGWVTLRSRPGRGSSFRLFIPRVAPDVCETCGLQADEVTVLVVDDQAEYRRAAREVLKRAGYTVLTASGADEAIEVFRKQADRITVSIVDLLMPGKGGKVVLDAILAADPSAQVVVASGFSHDYVRGQLARGAWGFLQKPFNEAQLLHAVNVMLVRAGARKLDPPVTSG